MKWIFSFLLCNNRKFFYVYYSIMESIFKIFSQCQFKLIFSKCNAFLYLRILLRLNAIENNYEAVNIHHWNSTWHLESSSFFLFFAVMLSLEWLSNAKGSFFQLHSDQLSLHHAQNILIQSEHTGYTQKWLSNRLTFHLHIE